MVLIYAGKFQLNFEHDLADLFKQHQIELKSELSRLGQRFEHVEQSQSQMSTDLKLTADAILRPIIAEAENVRVASLGDLVHCLSKDTINILVTTGGGGGDEASRRVSAAALAGLGAFDWALVVDLGQFDNELFRLVNNERTSAVRVTYLEASEFSGLTATTPDRLFGPLHCQTPWVRFGSSSPPDSFDAWDARYGKARNQWYVRQLCCVSHVTFFRVQFAAVWAVRSKKHHA